MSESKIGIHFGDRNETFKTIIHNVLKKGKIGKKYTDLLLSPPSLKRYSAAFTSELVNEIDNYQVYEQLGDLSCNKFIVSYIYSRFPKLKCSEGVKVVARLRINYGSKESFSKISEELKFWEFITAPIEVRERRKKDLLEDVFEAFIGVTESILDEDVRQGIGYACVYKILTGIFESKEISLKYEDLYDAKTRLKELFDLFGEKLGPLNYTSIGGGEEKKGDLPAVAIPIVCTVSRGKVPRVTICTASADTKAEAEQIASQIAIEKMMKEGFVKKIPKFYSVINEEKEEKNKKNEKEERKMEVMRIMEGDSGRINELFHTRGKSKYKAEYKSTLLVSYCRKGDWVGIRECMKMGGDLNMNDTEGMSGGDYLVINGILNRKKLEKLKGEKISVHGEIWNIYSSYLTEDVTEFVNIL